MSSLLVSLFHKVKHEFRPTENGTQHGPYQDHSLTVS